MFESVKKWEGKGGRRIFPTLALLGHVEGGGEGKLFFEVFWNTERENSKRAHFFARKVFRGNYHKSAVV